MRAFYAAYPETPTIVPQAVGQTDGPLPDPVLNIPWDHNAILIEKVKNPRERVWYARQTIGVSEWRTRIGESLPEQLRGSLPTIEELENELAGK